MGSITALPAGDRHPLCDSEDLAADVALGYFDEDAICLRYAIDVATLAKIGKDAAFRRLALDALRRQDEAGDAFRLAARRRMDGMLDVLQGIAKDAKASKSTRIQAVALLGKYAGHESAEAGSAGVVLQIRTNLDVGRANAGSGTYTLIAAAGEQPGEPDDGGDLL